MGRRVLWAGASYGPGNTVILIINERVIVRIGLRLFNQHNQMSSSNNNNFVIVDPLR